MEQLVKLAPLISTLVIFSGFLLALFQFKKQLAYRKIENLQKIWKDFINDRELFDLFSALDNHDEKKSVKRAIHTSNKTKLKFLGLLDEVALLVEKGDVDREYAIYLFQWHFFYAYKKSSTMESIWQSLGGVIEASKPYWLKSARLAEKCNSHPD